MTISATSIYIIRNASKNSLSSLGLHTKLFLLPPPPKTVIVIPVPTKTTEEQPPFGDKIGNMSASFKVQG